MFRKNISKNSGAILFILISLFFTLNLSSCSKRNSGEIPLDNSDPLALAPDVQWAVVNDPYAAFRTDTSWTADAAGYCKQGEFFPILAITYVDDDKGGQTWYRFKNGWLPGSLLSVYPNKLRAAKAASALVK
jgi:hypothetical protein